MLSNKRFLGRGSAGESGSESGAGFSRDAVGRRSMSEKRHAAMDAKQTGTYKKIKEIKAINCEYSTISSFEWIHQQWINQ